MPQYERKKSCENLMEKPINNIYRNIYMDTTERFSASRQIFIRWTGSCYKIIWHEFVLFIFGKVHVLVSQKMMACFKYVKVLK